jgi:dTDP-4-dehydrorhamnose reductase
MGLIAVTGSGGQLGSELCRQFGAQAVGLDLPEFDLTSREAVAARLEAIRPRAVVNTAAYTQVDRAEDDANRCRAVNAQGVAHLAESCRRLDCVLVQVSTDYVFGGDRTRSTPYTETDPPAPQGVYATTKLEGESHAARWEKHFIVRTCGLYGMPGPRASGNFVETMLRLAGQRSSLRVVNDQRCTPSYTAHVARAIRFLVSTRAYGTYHLVNTGETTWFDFATEVFARSGIDIAIEPITTAEYGARAPRPPYSVLSTAKYHALPGRPTMPRWQDALSQYLSIRGAR